MYGFVFVPQMSEVFELENCVKILWLIRCENTMIDTVWKYCDWYGVKILWLILCENTVIDTVWKYCDWYCVKILWLILCENTVIHTVWKYCDWYSCLLYVIKLLWSVYIPNVRFDTLELFKLMPYDIIYCLFGRQVLYYFEADSEGRAV